jgi:hypothetical protein
MILERIACSSLCVIFASAVAIGQQTSDAGNPQPARTVIEHTNDGRVIPWRAVRTRSASGDREVVAETVEAPDVDGRMSPIQESVTETIRSVPTRTQTRSDVFGFGGDGRRQLLRTIESQEETLPNRDTSAAQRTFTPDLNGRTAETSRTIENTRAITPTVRQTVTTTLSPGPNAALQEITRVEQAERTDPSVVQHESTHLVRDVNGRWLAIERRAAETRQTGASQRSEAQTIERVDLDGHATIVERTVSSRSGATDPDDEVVERHIPYVDPLRGSTGGLALGEQIHRTTTKTADGGRSTVEEVQGRNPVSPGDPMRVIRRTVTTVRPTGPNHWTTEREVFERDVNGRMTRIAAETEASSGEK